MQLNLEEPTNRSSFYT